MAIEIREARAEEYEEAGRVTALAYREFAAPDDEDWQEYLRRIADVASRARAATVLVALDDGRILGSATVELETRMDADDPPLLANEVHVRMLGVHPEARRRGIARALLAEVDGIARGAGRTRVTLGTTRRMRAAQSMYEHLGYRRLEDHVFPDGFVLFSYEKDVPPEA